HPGRTTRQASAGGYPSSRQSHRIWGTYARHIGHLNNVGIDAHIDLASAGDETIALIQEILLRGMSHFVAPAYGAALFAGEEPVLAADGVCLSAQADVAVAGKRTRWMFQSLAEWRTAMPLAVHKRTDVEVSVDIHDAELPALACITEKMAVSRLVAAAQDNRDRTGVQQGRDNLSEGGLGVFQFSRHSHIAQVERWRVGELDICLAIP